MKFTNIVLIAAVVTAQNDYDYPAVDLKSSCKFKKIENFSNFLKFLATAGVDRIDRVVGRYNEWIEKYGQEYKKTPKLERSVERMRKYVS